MNIPKRIADQILKDAKVHAETSFENRIHDPGLSLFDKGVVIGMMRILDYVGEKDLADEIRVIRDWDGRIQIKCDSDAEIAATPSRQAGVRSKRGQGAVAA